jgi:hypothetical protein
LKKGYVQGMQVLCQTHRLSIGSTVGRILP